MSKDDKELIEPMEFYKVEKISDDIYAIGPNIILRFNTHFFKTVGDKKYYFYKEYEYPVKGIPNHPSAITIRRTADYYLSIENMQKDVNGNKMFIRIGASEIILFQNALEECIRWFTDKAYEKLFAFNDGKLILVHPIPDFKMNNLPMNKFIEFAPTVIDRGIANSDKEPGVRINFNNECSIDINVDRLMGLYYTISSFNMYLAASLMVNSLNLDLGTNRVNMGNGYLVTPKEKKSKSIEGRLVSSKYITDIDKKLEG